MTNEGFTFHTCYVANLQYVSVYSATSMSHGCRNSVHFSTHLVERLVDLHEGVRWRLALGADDDAHVHDDELVAGRHVGGAPVRQVRQRVGRVVHVGRVPVRRELQDLGAPFQLLTPDEISLDCRDT